MPRLLIFAPCKIAILEKDSFNLSLISVLEHINLTIPKGIKIPERVLAPFDWSIVTVWLQEPGDEAKQFIQHTELILSNGELGSTSDFAFYLTERTHRVIVSVPGFPIGQPGECMIRLSLAERGGQKALVVVEYPLVVNHILEDTTT